MTGHFRVITVAWVASLCGFFQSGAGTAAPPSVLRTVREVRELPPAEAMQARPTAIRGVVLVCDPDAGILFLRDRWSGLLVDVRGRDVHFLPGQEIETRGVTAVHAGMNYLAHPDFHAFGTRALPPSEPATVAELLANRESCRWVKISGTISGLTNHAGRIELEITSQGARIQALLPLSASVDPSDWVGSTVVIRAVVSNLDLGTTGHGVPRLYIPSLAQVTLSDDGLPPASAADEYPESDRPRDMDHALLRVGFRGTVTLVRGRREVFVQNESTGARLLPRRETDLHPGDTVEAVGLPVPGGMSMVLEDAVVRRTGTDRLPVPLRLPHREISFEEHGRAFDSRRVEIEARLLGRKQAGREIIYSLQSGPLFCSAFIDAERDSRALRSIPDGSLLHLTGVLSVQAPENGARRGFHLYLDRPEHVVLVEEPGWWTTRRLLHATGLLAVIGLLATGWNVLLRRKVESQTAQLSARLHRETALKTRYRDLFEHARDFVFTTDSTGRFTAVNRAGEELMGYARDEFTTLSLADVLDGEQGRSLSQALAGQASLPPMVTARMRAKDGTLIDVQVSARLLMEEDKIAGLQGICRDVTEEKRASEAVRQTEEIYRRAIALADAVPYSRDYQTERYTFVGEGIREITGYAPEELTPEIWDRSVQEATMLGEAAGLSLEEAKQKTRAGGILRWAADHRIVTRSGETRWIADRSIQVMNDRDLPVGSIGILQDITDRKRAEENLERSLAHFKRVVESNLIGILFWNEEGRVTDFNERFAEMSGLDRAALAGASLPWRTLTVPTHPTDAGKADRELAELGRTGAHECKLAKSDGSTVPVLVGATYLDADRKEGITFVLDVSEKLNLEGQLRQAQKMESIGRLAGGVAHDFNNLLTVIQGHCGLLLMSRNIPAEEQEAIREINNASERAASLTRQLLTFSRKQVMQRRPLNLRDVVSQLTKMLTRLLGEDILLQCSHAQDLPPVNADRGMIEQVLMNLSVNARDAMPRGGRLTINTSVVSLRGLHLASAPKGRTGRFVCISIADTGCGMDEATQDHIFEPFFTTKEVGKGTGLGLATVYGIVDQHGGWIDVTSQVGVGTIFRIFLPAVETTGPEAAGQAPTEEMHSGHETILLAEDDPSLRRLVRQSLVRCGYSVLEAASGNEALKLWQKNASRINLLLTDMVMPEGLSGRELARRLQGQDPKLKVVYTTGYSLEAISSDCELIDGLNFLPKPYHPSRLTKTVRACLDT